MIEEINSIKEEKALTSKKVIITDNIATINELCDYLENLNSKITVLNMPHQEEVLKELKRRNTCQGFNQSILNKVKQICENYITKDDYVVDMTVGNGHDTLFLCNLAKFVFGFDIQEQAINNTTNLLKEHNITNYQLFLKSHEFIHFTLKDYKEKISLILYNLGYLPNGNKTIMTNHKSTLNSLINAFSVLKENGLILMVFYPHEEGIIEANTIKSYLQNNNISYEEYHNTSNEFAPYLIVIKATK